MKKDELTGFLNTSVLGHLEPGFDVVLFLALVYNGDQPYLVLNGFGDSAPLRRMVGDTLAWLILQTLEQAANDKKMPMPFKGIGDHGDVPRMTTFTRAAQIGGEHLEHYAMIALSNKRDLLSFYLSSHRICNHLLAELREELRVEVLHATGRLIGEGCFGLDHAQRATAVLDENPPVDPLVDDGGLKQMFKEISKDG